jgi:hypothetical protein
VLPGPCNRASGVSGEHQVKHVVCMVCNLGFNCQDLYAWWLDCYRSPHPGNEMGRH